MAYIVFSSPVKMLPIFDTAVAECQEELLQQHEERTRMVKKSNCHVRIFGFNFQNSDGITTYPLITCFSFSSSIYLVLFLILKL